MLNWFKKKLWRPDKIAAGKDESTEMELFELLAVLLAQEIGKDREELFRGAVIEARKGIVYISKLNIVIRCQVLAEQQHEQAIVYCIAFSVSINEEEIFYEEMMAIGTDPFAAMQHGVAAFNTGFLVGFLQSFSGCYEPDFQLYDTGDHKFHLVYSPLQVQGAFKADDSLIDKGLVSIMFPLIQELFSQLAHQKDYIFREYYWIRIYLSRHPDDKFIGECRFNNEEWSMGLAALVEQDYEKWEKAGPFRGKKQFIFIKRCVVSNCIH